MSLSIKLDCKKNYVFVPGDRVAGKVILHCTKNGDVTAVTVKFRGRINMTVNDEDDNRKYSWNQILFIHEETLFQGPFTFPSNSIQQWDFSFIFPEHIEEEITDQFAESSPFQGPYGLERLPPSCIFDQYGSNAAVSYEIVAKIPRRVVSLKAAQQLFFSDFNYYLRPDPHMERREKRSLSHRLNVDYTGQPRDLTNKETMRERLGMASKGTRIVFFSIAIESPTVIVLGEPISFHATIHADDPNAVVPPFTLRGYRAFVEVKSLIRTPSIISHNDVKDHSALLDSEVRLGNDLTIPLEVGVPAAFGKVTLTPTSFPPSFTSFSIVRGYSLTIVVALFCLEKEFQVRVKFPDIRLLPYKLHPMHISENLNSGVSEERGEFSLDSDHGDMAPIYEPPDERTATGQDAAPIYEQPVEGSAARQGPPAYEPRPTTRSM